MSEHRTAGLSRRQFFGRAAGVAAAGAVSTSAAEQAAAGEVERAATKGRVKQSVARWCFKPHWDLEKHARVAKQLGCDSIELVPPEKWGILKKHGLVCAVTPNGMPAPPFKKGLNNPRFHDEVIGRTRKAMEATADAGFPNVIAFTGYRWWNPTDPSSGVIPPDIGADNCVKALKRLAKDAEKHKVNVCMEVLNSRDETDPMKGHPGYQGDDVDYCAEIIRRVGSPRVKLLFDIYHVQIMNGDVIRRIREYADIIGHIHTAGVPGRGELDDTQELNYPPIIRALVDNGFDGYVAQEFIPTGDPLAGLKQAVKVCDV